ncbi:hypothetical protein BH18ACT13_BH18ACT13_01760 [soil metagenome]
MDGFVLDRFPLPLTQAQYDDASSSIERLLLMVPGVVSVYRTGSVSAPGISDLDRIAVTSPEGPFRGIWEMLTETQRYAAMHTPFISSVSTFAEHSSYANLEPLEHVAGQQIAFDRPCPASVTFSRVLGIEGLVTLRLKLEKQAVTGRVKVRPLLCELHNLRHCLRLAGLDEQAAHGAWEVARAITELRASWWEWSPKKRQTSLLDIFCCAIAAIDAALQSIDGPTGGSTLDRFQLRDPWQNVTLIVGKPARSKWLSSKLLNVSRMSRRATEILWRSANREFCVPAAVISTLHEVRAGPGIFADRRQRVARYQDFMRSAGRGWSQIGVARAFAP